MTYEKKINNTETSTESVAELTERPVDELAAFIGGDSDVFHTLINEVNNLEIPDEEKNKKLENVYKAANESGVDFLTLDKAEKVATQLEE